MAIKKSEIYSTLWEACDELRGGMDASQYKDYVLTLLFVKYVSDKYADDPYGEVLVPPDGSFAAMVAVKGKSNIGEEIDKIIGRLAEANELNGVINKVSFNDPEKMGVGKEMVDKLTNLISIFQNPKLNFAQNRADGDDLIGDAYEYLMRKFAAQGGKSKGQFYTPAEVSRVLAKLLGIGNESNPMATVYDPACGSGSLLLRALNEAPVSVSGYGQEMDIATAGLAVMNAFLHGKTTTVIKSGNTFANPQYLDDEELKTFDYAVVNPPFSDKKWTNGYKDCGQFNGYEGRPPAKNGDYAWLMQVIKSLKPNGKAAVILPHGVLFRGNSEATLRKEIIDRGWIKGIVSLPPNLFYGTGIAACIIVLDGENREARDGIFMIDASHDFVKDGDKNRLRERDIYKIVTTFNQRIELDSKYARFVPMSEIKNDKNDYDLNISRYIDSTEPEDIQDIEAHLHGGIPMTDIDNMSRYWSEFPALKNKLFGVDRENYYKLNVSKDNLLQTIAEDEEYANYGIRVTDAFIDWKNQVRDRLLGIDNTVDVKKFIADLGEDILAKYAGLDLLDKYDVYQVLLAYWNDVMADDVYLIREAGYMVGREIDEVHKLDKNKEETGKVVSWEGKLLPKNLLVARYFIEERHEIDELVEKAEQQQAEIDEIIESAEEDSVIREICNDKGEWSKGRINDAVAKIRSNIVTDVTTDLENILSELPLTEDECKKILEEHPDYKKATVKKVFTEKKIQTCLRQIRNEADVMPSDKEDYDTLVNLRSKVDDLEETERTLKEKQIELDKKLREKYPTLMEKEIKDILVNDKWCDTLQKGVDDVYTLVVHAMKNRITKLVERYEDTLPELQNAVNEKEAKVKAHLERMGFVW